MDPRPPFLTRQEFDAFVETFTATGFTGGINWYRNLSLIHISEPTRPY